MNLVESANNDGQSYRLRQSHLILARNRLVNQCRIAHINGARRVDDIQQVQLVGHDGKPHSQAEDGNQKVHTNDLISHIELGRF